MSPAVEDQDPGLLPLIPRPAVLWRSFSFWIWVLLALLVFSAAPDYIVQYWFNQSLGFQTIFWTNVGAQLSLLIVYGAFVASAVYLPTRLHATSGVLRKSVVHVAIWVGLVAGWILTHHYQQFLLAFNGVPFGETDPVFAKDIGFYVYRLPAIRIVLVSLQILVLLSAVSFLIARASELRSRGALSERHLSIWSRAELFIQPVYLRILVGVFGASIVARTYVSRYALLMRNNEDSGVRTGAEYLDVTGLFSTLNSIYFKVVVVAGLTVSLVVALSRLSTRIAEGTADSEEENGATNSLANRRVPTPVAVAGALVAAQIVFSLLVLLRNVVAVEPNEPYIQLDYIDRHITATTRAYGLDRVEVHEWQLPEEPLSPERLLASKTVQNAPYLPTWVSYLEEPPDVQQLQRIEVSDSKMVFGPMLQIYQQQQQLRPYYHIISVDGVRYTVDGQKQMYVSAVRELPSLALIGRQEWLRYWGSAALLLTHGMGLIMSPANAIDEVGAPEYVVKDLPPQPAHPAFEHEPRIYFGEGARDHYVLTNVKHLQEFDYATDQGRQEFTFPSDLVDGLPVDSVFKRLMFALYTKDVTAFLFSDYIDHEQTRVHIQRTPMSRARSIAPFLFLDSNCYAFIADRKVLWLINGLTTSAEYPYSYPEILGDKADERSVESFPERVINYAEDSVKITIDAYSGEIRFYRIADDPIVETWEKIYPDLFEPASAMPEAVTAQLTYPLQWLHIQFDDIYKRYHQKHPVEFYNVEDLWDDADETLGSIGRGLSGFGSGDQLTFSYEGYNILLDPADLPEGVDIGSPGELQYAMLLPFTPEAARNLRSLIVACQDPGQYGRLISLQIPQGSFVPGPEQIDAYIDNDRPVHQQVTMWIRHSSEVIRGSTLLLPVAGDLLYLETIWVNSLQNELPQLKLFAIRYHDLITSAGTLEEAILNRTRLLEALRER
jgi:uncharacterized membrane protein (UPF0182 family)